MTDDRIMAILDRAADFGLNGYGGHCGEAALAVNQLLLGGRGRYIGIVNKYLWNVQNRFAGHVVVSYRSNLYDAEGMWEGDAAGLPEQIPDDLIEWGMVDQEDPDYSVPSEKAASEVIVVSLSKREVEAFRKTGKPFEAIRAAITVLGVE